MSVHSSQRNGMLSHGISSNLVSTQPLLSCSASIGLDVHTLMNASIFTPKFLVDMVSMSVVTSLHLVLRFRCQLPELVMQLHSPL